MIKTRKTFSPAMKTNRNKKRFSNIRLLIRFDRFIFNTRGDIKSWKKPGKINLKIIDSLINHETLFSFRFQNIQKIVIRKILT